MIVKTNVEVEKVEEQCDDCARFNEAVRNLQGWFENFFGEFDLKMISYLKPLLIESFGVDDMTEYEMVDIEVQLHDAIFRSGVSFFNRSIGRAYTRNSGAKMASGIYLISGNVRSGGSVKQWRTEVGGTILITGVPKVLVENNVELKQQIAAGTVKIVVK